jgi:hypothetical protein
VALALLAGCDGTPAVDSSKNEGTIKGVVTYKGKPVEAGDIIFDPSNHLRKTGERPAPIGPDGTFAATTYTGNNRIKVGGALLKAHPELFFMKKFMDVKRGENTADEPSGLTTSTFSGAFRAAVSTRSVSEWTPASSSTANVAPSTGFSSIQAETPTTEPSRNSIGPVAATLISPRRKIVAEPAWAANSSSGIVPGTRAKAGSQ